MNLRTNIIALLLLFLGSVLTAQNAVKYGNDYLAIGVGARAHGMGKSIVASVADGNAVYWNPAGLTMLSSSFEVNLMHAEWFSGIAKYDYVSFAKSLGEEKESAFAVAVIRLGIDNIPNTFNLVGADGSINPDLVTGFSYADYAALASYSHKLRIDGLRLGGTAKVIYRNAGQFGKAWGFGADLGVQYDVQRWKFGLMARDITSTFNAWSFDYTEEEIATLLTTGNEISDNSIEIVTPRFILGAAFASRKTGEEKIGILVEMDADFTTDGQRNVLISSKSFNMDPSIGLELDYKQLVFLRAGVNNFQETFDDEGGSALAVQPNMGIGLKLGMVTIDYALNNVGSAGNSGNYYSHIISLGVRFKEKPKKEKKPKPKKQPKPKKKAYPDSDYPDYIEQID